MKKYLDAQEAIWPDRFIKREMLSAGELAKRFNICNPRLHPEMQRDATEESLDAVGWIDAISISTNGDEPASLIDNSDAILFDGHERVKLVLLKFGVDTPIPARWYRLSPGETDFALLVKDQTSSMAKIDPEKMSILIKNTSALTISPGLQGMLDHLRVKIADGGEMPDFQSVGVDEQLYLDRLNPIFCPHCGRDIRDKSEAKSN